MLLDQLQKSLGTAYTIDRELGGGGMSKVFLATENRLHRKVVVKVLSPELAAGVSAERFEREIQLAAQLQQANIVPLLATGDVDGLPWFTMPFVEGESLRAKIARDGRLGITECVSILRDIARALGYAHGLGIVHRDIKPDNVLLSHGAAVVTDFGIAKALSDSRTDAGGSGLTQTGTSIGSPAYMAPEQIAGDPNADHRSDLYAFGCMAYELVAGEPPFTATSPQRVFAAHLAEAPRPIATLRADIPASLAAIIMRCLEKDPADRPASASEILAALESVSTSEAAATTAPIRATSPRKSWPAYAAVVLALVAVSAYAVRSRQAAGQTPVVAEGAELIAVMPLTAVSDTSLSRLGQDLVITLSANLDGVGSLQTVDAVTLLMRTRSSPSPLALADARKIAGELGARSVLTGTLIREGDAVRASVSLHPLGSDSTIAKATAVAAPGNIAALTDSLSWSVLEQVWRRGTAPSPVLTGLTTSSFEALRSFLDGERLFLRLEPVPALAAYRRAFELDSNFVQAYLRFDYANNWSLFPTDAAVRDRLLSLQQRLPERERLWVEARNSNLPFLGRNAQWKELAQRYPDYPPVLMSAADGIIHTGPLYGVPISDASPYLSRLAQLVPDHADTRVHQYFVAVATSSPDVAAAYADSAAHLAGPPFGELLQWLVSLHSAGPPGADPASLEKAFAASRALLEYFPRAEAYILAAGSMGFGEAAGSVEERLRALDAVRRKGIYTPSAQLSTALGEGLMRISRGDWSEGMRALRRAEQAQLSVSARSSSARVAILGAWLGAVNPSMADSALRRVEALVQPDAAPFDKIELRWLDGLQGITLGDLARVRRARQMLLADSTPASLHAARSLTGLWLDHAKESGAADTLIAVSEAAIATGDFLLDVEGINRLVIAPALRQRKTPGDVERYLMWVDAGVNSTRSISTSSTLRAPTLYERGVALDEAGDREAAIYQLRKFVQLYDQPPAQHRAMVADAKERLARLERSAAPQR